VLGLKRGLTFADGCVTESVGNLEQNELLHTGAGWLHSFDTEAAEGERRGQSTNLDRIEKSNADFIRFKQLRQSRYVD
jgi:hypothetical protein